MNSESYKGFAHNEYELYETLDNGRSWQPVGPAPVNATQCFDRIIYGSEENQGLRYSDNGGKDIFPSDQPTGNWDCITYVDDKVYAHSMDGLGIYYSENTETNGIGEIWTKIAEAPKDLEVQVVGNKLYFQPEMLIEIENGKVIQTIPNARFENGSTTIKENLPTDIPGLLLYIMNNVALPQLVYRLTGNNSEEVLSQFNEGITYSNTSYKSFFTDNQLMFGKSDVSTEDFTNDDFRTVVGMMPLIVTGSDIKQEVDLTNIPLNSEVNLEMNDTLRDTLDTIDEILSLKKDYAVRRMADEITSVETECDNLLDLNLTNEEFANALANQKMFYDVQKASIISIMGTILGALYSFDVQRKIALMKAAIYETLINIAPSIQFKLNYISRLIQQSDFTINENLLKFNYDFAGGLETAITKYFDTVFKNIRLTLTSEASDLKGSAASWYKENYREPVLQSVSDYVKTMNISYSDESYQNIKKLYEDVITSIKEYAKDRDEFVSQCEAYLNSANSSVTGETILNAINKKNFEYGNERIKSLSGKDVLINEIKSIKETKYNNLDNDLNNIKNFIESNDFVKNFMDPIYTEMDTKINEYVNSINIEDYYYDDNDYLGFTNEDIETVQKYYKIIVDKFNSRCLELLKLIYENFLSNIKEEDKEDGYDYYKEYFYNNVKDILEVQVEEDGNYNRGVENVFKLANKNIISLLKKSWVSMKEMI